MKGQHLLICINFFLLLHYIKISFKLFMKAYQSTADTVMSAENILILLSSFLIQQIFKFKIMPSNSLPEVIFD